jgi:protein involved in polysaccharide export with SLBB domain
MLPRANGAFRNRLRSIPRRRFLAAPLKVTTADVVVFGLLVAAMTTAGCNSILNGWLDPTTLGNFDRTSTSEIRTSLTLDDSPTGIPGAVPPSMDDLRMVMVEYPISPGDTLAVEINELRQRQVPYQIQAQVALAGYVNLPVVGRVPAAGLTVPEFEDALAEALRSRNVLLDPEVTVNPLFLQKATYSIFGVGVSASANSPLRAGTFPIRHPDLRLLEAINQVGGLNEFVTEIYVFRYEDPPAPVRDLNLAPVPLNAPSGDAGARSESRTREGLEPRASSGASAKQELLDAVAPEPKGKAETGARFQSRTSIDDIPESLEPDPTQPYIYVNKEFVPNPTYVGAHGETATAPPEIPPFDTAAPAVNWSRIAGDTSYRVLLIPAEALRSGDPDANIFIRAGDVIRIASGEVGVYYVMGQVGRVGTFAFNAEPITLKAAIAAAGGLSSLAWPDRCTVYRRLGQREQMIQVNLDRIFAGLDPDFTIKRGDIINVGTHPFAPFLERIRGLTLPNPVSNVGYSFTYARNFADVDSFSVKQNPADKPKTFPNLFPSTSN